MAAYRRVYDSRHLQADCQEPRDQPRNPTLGSRIWATFTFIYIDMDAKFHIRGNCGSQVHRVVHCGPESVDTTLRRRLESVRCVVLLDAHIHTHTHTHTHTMDRVVEVDGSRRHRCDLRWANRPMREAHGLPQTPQVYIIVPLATTRSFLAFRLATRAAVRLSSKADMTFEQHCLHSRHSCQGVQSATRTEPDRTLTHPFNGPLSGTTRVSRYQKDKNQSGFY